MKLKRLILDSFRPFKVPGITHLDYTIDKAMQVILGTNGSGKSKLFQELSPLPTNIKLFRKGGYKKIFIEHNNKNYILTSGYGKGDKPVYSFFCEEEDKEYNPSNKVTLQKQLVETIFGYTDKIHALVTGKVNFAEMPNNQRKELLLRASSVDLTYVLEVFKMAHRKHRDLIGAYKHTEARVKDLGSRIVTEEEKELLEKRYEKVVKQIEGLKAFVAKHDIDDEPVVFTQGDQHDINMAYYAAKSLVPLIDKLKTTYDGNLDIREIENKIAIDKAGLKGVTSQLESTKKQADEAFTLSMKLDSVPDELKGDNASERLKELELEKEQIVKGIKINFQSYGYSAPVLSKFMQMYSALCGNLGLPKNIMTYDDIVKNINLKKDIDARVTQLKKDKEHQEAHLREAQLASTGNVTCKSCGFENIASEISSAEYIKGVSQKIFEIENNIKKLEETIPQQTKELLKETLEAYDSMHRLVSETLSDKEIGFLSDGVDSSDRFITKLVNNTSVIKARVTEGINNELYIAEMKEVEFKIDELKTYIAYSDLGVVEKAEYFENKLSELYEMESVIKERIENNTCLLDYLKELDNAMEQATKSAALYGAHEFNLLNSDLLRKAKETIADLEFKAKVMANSIYDAKHFIGILDDAKKELMELDIRRKDLSNLVLALSPTTGIIGDVLRNLLESFSQDVSEALETIWGYEIELLPYAKEDVLDFKMPVRIIDEEVDDIIDCSDGQKDIINFAISICLMEYLGINGYPVFMDEIGSTFDVTHSENLITFTNDITESGKASQLFMISHHISQYGGHLNADFNVISQEGVMLPESFNENLKLKIG